MRCKPYGHPGVIDHSRLDDEVDGVDRIGLGADGAKAAGGLSRVGEKEKERETEGVGVSAFLLLLFARTQLAPDEDDECMRALLFPLVFSSFFQKERKRREATTR